MGPAQLQGSKVDEKEIKQTMMMMQPLSISFHPWKILPRLHRPAASAPFGARATRKNKKKDGDGTVGSTRDFEKINDEMLSDLSTFSLKDQQRRLKKALKEEEKISQETEKVIKWVKQASARMDADMDVYTMGNPDEKFQ